MSVNQIIEPNALDQYINLLGDEADEFIRDIINTFLDDSTNQITELKDSLRRGDSESFRRAAHTLKTECATVGAVNLAKEFLKLEKLGAEGNLPPSAASFEDCLTDLEAVRKQFLEKMTDQS